MSQTVAHLVGHVVAHVPVRQWVLWPPIPLRVLLAAQPELVTLVLQVLQVVQRVVTRHLLDHAGLKSGLCREQRAHNRTADIGPSRVAIAFILRRG
jgi:hypothetical protein